MLSIGAMNGGQANYYLELAREDYYLSGGEPPGEWLGDGAALLGLAGEVAPTSLSSLFSGYAPGSEKKLVQNAGRANRQPGWDLTFSAPKSVSVCWSLADDVSRRLIQDAHRKAVAKTIRYLEQNHAYSRTGKAGSESVRSSLVVAAFEHSCSRALDPQLHSHCLVMNVGITEDGKGRSILSKPLYRAKMLAGAYYRCELAQELRSSLDVELVRPLSRDGRPQSWFEIDGVPEALLKHFSKRRSAIVKELGERGLESASAAAFAALATREPKDLVPPRAELQESWKSDATALEVPLPSLCKRTIAIDLEERQALAIAAVNQAADEIIFSENFFSEADLARRALEVAQEFGIDADEVLTATSSLLNQSGERFESLGLKDGRYIWTTREVAAAEAEFLKAVKRLGECEFKPVAERHVSTACTQLRGVESEKFSLDGEQQAAVRYLTQDRSSIKVVTGFAGTGKTDMLAAAREALEKGGYKVIGTALAGVAARTLEEKAGIPSATIRGREHQLYPDLTERLSHHAKQLLRAAAGKSTWRLEPLTIDRKTVLVIDEAGMVGTRDFAMLAKAVVDNGGTLVAIGDERQLSSIERGGGLAHLVAAVGGVRLTEIRRQTDPGDREAVKDLVAGDPAEALRHYAEKGQFFVGRSQNESRERLIEDWAEAGGISKPSDHRIFAGTRAEVEAFNELAQMKRAEAGTVDLTQSVEHNSQRFAVGDQVRFSTADRTRGIQKGETGTVIACRDGFAGKYVAVQRLGPETSLSERALEVLKHHGTQLINAALGRPTARLPQRRDIVLVPLKPLNPMQKGYSGLTLDYCMTTHLGQGQTVQNAYVQLGGQMTDRELVYVQASRHKEKLSLYAIDSEVGAEFTAIARATRPLPEQWVEQSELPDRSSLIAEMKLSRAKQLAVDVALEQQRHTLQQQS